MSARMGCQLWYAYHHLTLLASLILPGSTRHDTRSHIWTMFFIIVLIRWLEDGPVLGDYVRACHHLVHCYHPIRHLLL